MHRMILARIGLGCCFVLSVTTARASDVFFNFGTGGGVSSTYPTDSDASNSTNGVLLSTPITLDGGALVLTSSSGNVYCDVGTTLGTCGDATGLTVSNAYGLGAGATATGGGRVSTDGPTLIFTVQPGFTVALVSFTVTGFSTGEIATYSQNGGGAVDYDYPGGGPSYTDDVAGETLTSGETLVFGAANGNYSLAALELDINETASPEPATLGMAGLALAGLLALGRKIRA